MNINENKGSEDIFLRMEKQGCGAYGPLYAAMTYRFVDVATRPPSGIGLHFLSDTKTLLIEKAAQNYMPVNKDIVILVNANWYTSHILSVSYTLRW